MSIENLKKHAGQLANTGVRVAVVFRKLPNDTNNCLIVETERLPDSYHDFLMQCLNSREASETNDFYEVLNRRTFPDGTNCLTSLHQRGFLRKEPVSNVNMIPLPGKVVPLALINATIDKTVDQYMANQNNRPVESKTIDLPPITGDDAASIAKGLIVQAELLEKDAAAKREEAYALDPSSKPGRGRPPTPEELKEARAEEKKEKRRERDRANAAAARIAKAEASLNEKVEKKLKRDSERLSQAS
jgi:hypothetical protein